MHRRKRHAQNNHKKTQTKRNRDLQTGKQFFFEIDGNLFLKNQLQSKKTHTVRRLFRGLFETDSIQDVGDLSIHRLVAAERHHAIMTLWRTKNSIIMRFSSHFFDVFVILKKNMKTMNYDESSKSHCFESTSSTFAITKSTLFRLENSQRGSPQLGLL